MSSALPNVNLQRPMCVLRMAWVARYELTRAFQFSHTTGSVAARLNPFSKAWSSEPFLPASNCSFEALRVFLCNFVSLVHFLKEFPSDSSFQGAPASED